MSEFIALRKRARDKRDKIIAQARSEYEATLVTIASLEQDLLGKESSRHKMISSCVESVIPSDRTFCVVDIMTSLEALDPGRAWRKRSVDHHLTRLRQRGLIRRLKRHSCNEPAVYARVELPAANGPFGDMTILEVIRACLTRPMTQTELVMVMLESGYQTSMRKSMLRNRVGEVLRGYSGFQRTDDGKWSGSASIRSTA